MKRLIIISIILFTVIPNIIAGHPEEKIHISTKDLNTEHLKDAIGIITLNSGIRGGISLNLYEDNYLKAGLLNIRDNSKPISNYGYHPPVDTLVSNYRFLVLEENDEYYKIAFDYHDPKAYWVDKKELNDKFYNRIKYLNKIQTKHGEFISLFGLTNMNQRKIYSDPSTSSDFKIITKDEYQDKLIKIVEQKGEYIKIAIAVKNKQLQTEEIGEILGWIRIRDNQGRLNIWIIKMDLFG